MTTRQRRNCANALSPAGVAPADLVTDDTRPTTRKLRIVTQRQQQVARVDFETDADLDQSVAARVAAAVAAHAAHADVVLVSDYLKGCITADTMAAVLHAATPRGIAVLVDPKIPHLDLYRGVTLVTPNQVEAETATHARIRTDDEARGAARRLRERLACASVVITRGEHGMWVLDGSTTPATEANFAATALEVSDVTGAGDTVIGTLALALAAKATLVEAAQLSTIAAGVAVSRFGPVAVTRDELLASVTIADGESVVPRPSIPEIGGWSEISVNCLMAEMPPPREHHGDAVLVGGLDHFLIPH